MRQAVLGIAILISSTIPALSARASWWCATSPIDSDDQTCRTTREECDELETQPRPYLGCREHPSVSVLEFVVVNSGESFVAFPLLSQCEKARKVLLKRPVDFKKVGRCKASDGGQRGARTEPRGSEVVKKSTAPRGRPEFVMIDKKCSNHISSFGNERSPIASELPAKIRFCWRDGPAIDCEQSVAAGDKDKPHRVELVVAEEQSPRMVLTGADSALIVVVDWSRSEYLLAQTYFDKTKGFVVQLQCPGMIITGEALEQYMSKRAAAKP